MFLTNLFGINKKCSHKKVAPNVDFGYCPDCGKAIKNEWYITRCACCGVKLISIERNGNVYPYNKFCTNCGAQDYLVEKIENINVININYAVLVRKELDKQIKLAAKIAKENISLQKEITILKDEHLKEIMAVNDVVRSQEEYVYDLEQKLKTKKAQSKITVKENKIKTQVKKETEKPKKTRKTNKKGEDK